ncbi:MAG: hypothetical protein AAF936_11820 [Pseudomonadota bacterium]
MTNIAFATCNASPEMQPSDALVRDGLAARGATVAAAPWNGPQGAFEAADAVVIRSAWDYQYAPGDFESWLVRRDQRGLVLNPPSLMRWNMSKQYLLALAAEGAPLPPTRRVAPTAASIAAVMDEMGLAHAVVKPEFGATSSGLSIVNRKDEAGLEKAARNLAMPGVMQPILSGIKTRGETSFIFIDGDFTHAVTKMPKAGEIRSQKEFGGSSERADPPGWAVEAARRVLSMAPAPSLYARVDAIVLDDGMQLMELELIEPELFFTYAPEAADRFAAALMSRL